MADDRVKVDINVTADAKEVDDVTKAIENLQNTLGILDKEAGSSAKSIKDLGNASKGASKNMQSAVKSSDNLNKGLGSLAKSALKAVVAFKGFKMLGRFIKDGIGKAADYQESIHLFNVIFGKIGAEAGDAFNKEMWERLRANQDRFLTLGLDPDVMLEGQGVFASIADAAGIAHRATLDISEGLSMLASDYSAFRNIPIEDSMNKFQSGITGQIKSLRMFGIEVSMNALQAEALRYGINRTTAEMSQADKIQLRYLAIMRQGTVAMGDMAITAMSPANSFRILKTQIGEAGRALGSIFIPMIKAVMPYLIAMTRAVVRLFQAIALLFGYKPPKIGEGAEFDTPSDGGGVVVPTTGSKAVPPVGGDIGGQNKKAKKLKKTIKEIKNVMMGFDELNLLPELPDDPNIDGLNTPGVGGGGGGGGGLGGLGLDDLDLSSEIAEWTRKLREATDEALANLKLPGIDDPMFDRLKASADRFKESILRLGSAIGDILAPTWEKVLKPMGLWTISEVVPRIIDMMSIGVEALAKALEYAEPYLNWFYDEILVPMGQWAGEQLLEAMDWVIEKLERFSTWIDENSELVGQITAGILIVTGAITGMSLIIGITTGVVGLLGGAIGLLTSPIGLAIIAVGLIVGVLLGLKDRIDSTTKTTNDFSGVFSSSFDKISKLLSSIWDSVFKRVFTLLIDIIKDIIEILQELWAEYAQPIFEKLGVTFDNTVDLFSRLWFNILKPIWDTFMDTLDRLWTNHFKPLLENVGEFVGELIILGLDIYNKFIAPLVGFMIDLFSPIFVSVFNTIIDTAGDLLGGIMDVINGIIKVFKGLIKFVSGVFTGDWGKAWEGVKDIFGGVWDTLVSIAKIPINAIIGMVNTLVRGVTSGLNFVVRGMNKISFDIPDWIPGIGGKKFGINIKQLTPYQIPKLAAGGIVDEGQMFVAREAGVEMVGKHGRKTAVMNNAQIVDAVSSGVASAVSAVMGSGNNSGDIIIYVDGTRKVKKNISEMNRQSIINGKTVLNV